MYINVKPKRKKNSLSASYGSYHGNFSVSNTLYILYVCKPSKLGEWGPFGGWEGVRGGGGKWQITNCFASLLPFERRTDSILLD